MEEDTEGSNLTVADLLATEGGTTTLDKSGASLLFKPPLKLDKSLQTEFSSLPPRKPPTQKCTPAGSSQPAAASTTPLGDLDASYDSFLPPVADLLEYAESSLLSDTVGEATLRSLQALPTHSTEEHSAPVWNTFADCVNKLSTSSARLRGKLSKSQSERRNLITVKPRLHLDRSLRTISKARTNLKEIAVSESPKRASQRLRPKPLIQRKTQVEKSRKVTITTVFSPKLVTVDLTALSPADTRKCSPSFLALEPDSPIPPPKPHPRPVLEPSPRPQANQPIPSKSFNLVSRYRRTHVQLPLPASEPNLSTKSITVRLKPSTPKTRPFNLSRETH